MTNPPGPVPEFFAATDELTAIYLWARARYAAPWAVFWAVLLRVAATVEPTVQLPGLIGGRASLNLLCAFVAPSGGGKGISDKVARQAWPAPIEELPLGSGEGIAAAFKKPDNDGEEPRTRVLFNCPEIDTLTGLASRQGSVLLAQLKSMAMGEQIGQHNASKATSRVIGEHTYRACLSVGAQPGHTGVVFDDTTGGTPQRFIWALTIDPDMPAEPTAAPDPLDTTVPFWKPGTDGVVEIQYGPDEIAQTVIGAHLSRQRGESGALDGHAMLTRLKVAALLAILHKRSVVNETDWQLSAAAMAESDRTREWLLAEAKRIDRQKIHDRAMTRARGDEFITDRMHDRAKAALLRRIEKVTEESAGKLRGQLKANLRDHFGSAIAELVSEGEVLEIPTDRGTRYSLPKGPTLNLVQPKKEQVKCVGPESNVGPSAPWPQHPVSNLDSPKTCREWFDRHIRGLISDGHTTADSAAVYPLGEAAGWGIHNLRKVASKSPLIAIAEKRTDGVTWSIGEGVQSTHVPCPQWLVSYLRERGDWVPASQVYTAGAERYGRSAIKSAAQAARILKRGASIATEWSLDPNHQEKTA